jgi:prephenate dehydrogenase
MAALSRKLTSRVIGIHRDGDPKGQAIALGATTEQTYSIEEGAAEAELIFVCTPAGAVTRRAGVAAANCDPRTILTDVASTKVNIVAELDQLPVRFVGAHPLAGSHASGVEAARPDLFVGQRVVTTPTDRTDAAALERVEQFWRAMGTTTLRMSPPAHDEALAATSHLPHWVASALAACTPEAHLSLVALGWKDTTRVAAGNVEVWKDIFSENREQLLVAHARFVGVLDRFREALENRDFDSLVSLLELAKQQRESAE